MVQDICRFLRIYLIIMPLGVLATGCGEKTPSPHQVAAPQNNQLSKTEDHQGVPDKMNSAMPAGAISAGAPMPIWESPEVFMAVVKDVPAGDWTFGNPPNVIVEVEEVFRGKRQKGKLTVTWGPPPHDFDTTDREAELKLWKTRKLEVPKVGDKWIYWGWPVNGVLYTRADGRVPWSEENRARTIAQVQAFEQSRKAELRRQNRTPEEISKARQKWQAGIQEKDLKHWTAQADFIALGKTAGLGNGGEKWLCMFKIEEILKGRSRQKFLNDEQRVQVRVKDDIAELMTPWKDRYLLFLSERGMEMGPPYPPLYEPVGDAVVIPDETTKKIVRETLKEKSTEPVLTVALCGSWYSERKKAVGHQSAGAVVIGVGDAKEGAVQRIREQIQGLDYVVNIMDEYEDKELVEHAKGFQAKT